MASNSRVFGSLRVSGTVTTPSITEKTTDSGVQIEGVTLKDNAVIMGSGALATPGMTLSTAVNPAGIYRPAATAHTLALVTDSVERMRVGENSVTVSSGMPGTNVNATTTLLENKSEYFSGIATGSYTPPASSTSSRSFSGVTQYAPYASEYYLSNPYYNLSGTPASYWYGLNIYAVNWARVNYYGNYALNGGYDATSSFVGYTKGPYAYFTPVNIIGITSWYGWQYHTISIDLVGNYDATSAFNYGLSGQGLSGFSYSQVYSQLPSSAPYQHYGYYYYTSGQSTSGALSVLGGVGIAGNLRVGGKITSNNYRTSTSYLSASDAITSAFNFSGDTNTGIYRPADNTIGMATAGSNRMSISSSGLAVNSSVTTTTIASTTQSSSVSTGSVVVSGNLVVGGNLYVGGNVNPERLQKPYFATTALGSQSSPAYSFTSATGSGIWSAGSNTMCLSVAGVAAVYTDGTGYFSLGGGNYNITSANELRLGVSGSAGTSSTSVGQSCVAGSHATAIGAYASAAANSTAIGGWASTTGDYAIALGYQASAPAYTIVLAADSSNTTWTEFGMGYWQASSDERLKTNVSECTLGLDLITRVRPITFKWKKDDTARAKTQYGFSYQRLLQALQELGIDHHHAVDSRGEFGTVAPDELIPHIVRAVLELKEMVAKAKNSQ